MKDNTLGVHNNSGTHQFVQLNYFISININLNWILEKDTICLKTYNSGEYINDYSWIELCIVVSR